MWELRPLKGAREGGLHDQWTGQDVTRLIRIGSRVVKWISSATVSELSKVDVLCYQETWAIRGNKIFF